MSVVSFIRTIAAHSERWRGFTQSEDSWANHLTDDDLNDLAHETHQLHVPSLSQLVIWHPASMLGEPRRENAQDAAHYYSTWSAPRLRSFHIRNFVPIPFTASASLTRFSISLDLSRVVSVGKKLSSLIQFLASCSNLKEFGLEVLDLRSPKESPITNRCELASLKSLELEFTHCRASSIAPFFDAIRFPGVSTVKLRIIGSQVQEVLCTLLPENHCYNRLEYLVLTVVQEGLMRRPVKMPFSNLSMIRHLTLELRDSLVDPASIPNGPCLPSLRSLDIRYSRRLEREWFIQLLSRLKFQGNTPQLTVERCRWEKKNIQNSVAGGNSTDFISVQEILELVV